MIDGTDEFLSDFVARLQVMPAPRLVLELGTRRWNADRPTTHRDFLHERINDLEYIGADATDGDDVDVVADAHQLPFPDGHFDALLAVAVWEHLRRPWLAAAEAARVVRSGGVALVVTHQSFPLHGYPHDYFRFSDLAMRELFAADVGWQVVRCAYRYPAKVVPLTNDVHKGGLWNHAAEAWLNVEMIAQRL